MMNNQVTTANAVWIATALLHKQHPERQWFTSQEIERKVFEEGLHASTLVTLKQHISQHCVANKPANPGTHRKLFEIARGRRRIYLAGDPFHPSRSTGKTAPLQDEIPQRYRHLLLWYEEQSKNRGKPPIIRGIEYDRFAELLQKFKTLTPEERRERAKGVIKAVVAYERRR